MPEHRRLPRPLLLLSLVPLSAWAQQPPLPESTLLQIQTHLAAKSSRTATQRKVSSQLLEPPDAASPDSSIARAVEPVRVDIRATVTATLLDRIVELGGEVVNSVPEYDAVRARLPAAAVEPLAALEEVRFIRPAEQAVTRQALRTAAFVDDIARRAVDATEGDAAHRADAARRTHGVDGTGIGIGVVSDGVATLAARQATGDVASRVTVLPGQAGGAFDLRCGGRSSGDEGTAMLEIVHDLAPGAELYFADGGGGRAQMARNIEDLCRAGADVIVDDIGYLGASAFQDDVIARAIGAATAEGCFHFTSAGNGGNLNDGTSSVWEGDFDAGGSNAVNREVVGRIHDFGGGAVRNGIEAETTSPFFLQWSDADGASANDYDLFIVDADDNVLAASTNTQDGTQDPIEYVPGACSGEYADARVLVVQTSGAADRYLRLDYGRGALEHATAGKIFGHAAAADAVSVAAVRAPSTGAFQGTESVERFSSDGPRRVFYEADGAAVTAGNVSSTGGAVRHKPDLAAADGVATSTPGFSTFYGTSAAAPHAAAIAALMLEAAGGPGNVTLSALRAGMTGGALDIEASGVDRDSGAGIAMAPGAVDAVDVPAANRNRAPTAAGTLTAPEMTAGGAPATIELSGAFDDPDNDTLSYTALSTNPGVAEAVATGSKLRLTPRAGGVVDVTVRAVDGDGLGVTRSLSVTVAGTPPNTGGGGGPAAPRAGAILDFAHFADGDGYTSEIVLVNVGDEPIEPVVYFHDTDGAPAAVVDVDDTLARRDDGGLERAAALAPLREWRIATRGGDALTAGSVQVVSDGPVGGMLRIAHPDFGQAVVGPGPALSDAVFPARRREGGVTTGVALRNLESAAGTIGCELLAAGETLASADFELAANGQTSWTLDGAFPAADTAVFDGTVRCRFSGRRRFTAMALELDPGARVFTAVPVSPVDRGGGAAEMGFAHFANGDAMMSELAFVNLETRPGGRSHSPFERPAPPSRPRIRFLDPDGAPIAAESLVDVEGALQVAGDGALTTRDPMAPLDVVRVPTHRRGALATGSVSVVADGPVGGMLRFDLPGVGQAVTAPASPLSGAIMPARRREGGVTTGIAIHNPEPAAGLVRCELMRDGILQDTASTPLAAGGQTSWTIDRAFAGADTSDFDGWVRCTAAEGGRFTAVALEMDPGNRVFTALPVMPVGAATRD